MPDPKAVAADAAAAEQKAPKGPPSLRQPGTNLVDPLRGPLGKWLVDAKISFSELSNRVLAAWAMKKLNMLPELASALLAPDFKIEEHLKRGGGFKALKEEKDALEGRVKELEAKLAAAKK